MSRSSLSCPKPIRSRVKTRSSWKRSPTNSCSFRETSPRGCMTSMRASAAAPGSSRSKAASLRGRGGRSAPGTPRLQHCSPRPSHSNCPRASSPCPSVHQSTSWRHSSCGAEAITTPLSKLLSRLPTACSIQRTQTPFELRALHGISAECDCPLVRARGARGVACAAQQLGVRSVQRLVALERRIAEEGLEQRQARGVPLGHTDGDRAVELDHGRRVEPDQSAEQLRYLRPVGG